MGSIFDKMAMINTEMKLFFFLKSWANHSFSYLIKDMSQQAYNYQLSLVSVYTGTNQQNKSMNKYTKKKNP